MRKRARSLYALRLHAIRWYSGGWRLDFVCSSSAVRSHRWVEENWIWCPTHTYILLLLLRLLLLMCAAAASSPPPPRHTREYMKRSRIREENDLYTLTRRDIFFYVSFIRMYVSYFYKYIYIFIAHVQDMARTACVYLYNTIHRD